MQEGYVSGITDDGGFICSEKVCGGKSTLSFRHKDIENASPRQFWKRMKLKLCIYFIYLITLFDARKVILCIALVSFFSKISMGTF